MPQKPPHVVSITFVVSTTACMRTTTPTCTWFTTKISTEHKEIVAVFALDLETTPSSSLLPRGGQQYTSEEKRTPTMPHPDVFALHRPGLAVSTENLRRTPLSLAQEQKLRCQGCWQTLDLSAERKKYGQVHNTRAICNCRMANNNNNNNKYNKSEPRQEHGLSFRPRSCTAAHRIYNPPPLRFSQHFETRNRTTVLAWFEHGGCRPHPSPRAKDPKPFLVSQQPRPSAKHKSGCRWPSRARTLQRYATSETVVATPILDPPVDVVGTNKTNNDGGGVLHRDEY